MAGEQVDVRANDVLHEVQDLVGKEPFEQARVDEVGNIHLLGPLTRLEVRDLLLEEGSKREQLRPRKYLAMMEKVSLGPIVSTPSG